MKSRTASARRRTRSSSSGRRHRDDVAAVAGSNMRPLPTSTAFDTDAAGIRPVVTGPVYVRSQGQWRLGTLTVARDSLRFTSTGPASLGLVEVLLGCTDVARGRVLCSAEADHDPGVFEVEVLPSVRGAASKVVRELSVRASRDGRGECLWFKVGDMERATEWAEAVDDASQSAGDAAAGLIWDWFKVPAAGAAPAVFAFSTLPVSEATPTPVSTPGRQHHAAASASATPLNDKPIERDPLPIDTSRLSSSSSSSHGEGGKERQRRRPPPPGTPDNATAAAAAFRRGRIATPSSGAATPTATACPPPPPLHMKHRGVPLSAVRPLELLIVREYAAVARARRAKAKAASNASEPPASHGQQQAPWGPREW